MKRTFEYAIIQRAVDGDTFDVVIDLGFEITHLVRVRVRGINTAELKDHDKEKADLAAKQKAFAATLEKKFCSLIVHRQERYGRWEADVSVDGVDYAAALKAHIFNFTQTT